MLIELHTKASIDLKVHRPKKCPTQRHVMEQPECHTQVNKIGSTFL